MTTMTPLQVSELRYRRLFEGARDGILILDLATLQIVDANPYIQEFLNYSKEELLGKELWQIGLPKDRLESQHLYRNLQENGYIRYDDVPLESSDGRRHEVEFISNVYTEGDHSSIQCNIRDISQRKLREAHHERAVQAEKLRLLGELARGVAHDLNQSLALISGYSDLAIAAMADPALDRDALRGMLDVMAQAATDGGQIVSRLLTFARGQPEGEAQAVPLPALLARVGQVTAPRWRDAAQAEGRPIVLYVEAEPDTVILGWPTSLREALVNLIFNAVDALPEGGTIHLRAHRAGRKIAVEVQDSGTGMSPEVKARVLQPLFTTKGPYGTGLGLSQVLSMVEQHGGEISIDSTLGRGTTFRLAFPAAKATDSASAPRREGALGILVVDDEPPLADLLARMLRLDGHAVVTVHSGPAALECLSTESFDVMISDMGMPGMDGWELVRHVSARYPTIPVIMASGWGSQITPEEVRERGLQAVITKPYRRVDLQHALATLDRSPRRPAASPPASQEPIR